MRGRRAMKWVAFAVLIGWPWVASAGEFFDSWGSFRPGEQTGKVQFQGKGYLEAPVGIISIDGAVLAYLDVLGHAERVDLVVQTLEGGSVHDKVLATVTSSETTPDGLTRYD